MSLIRSVHHSYVLMYEYLLDELIGPLCIDQNWSIQWNRTILWMLQRTNTNYNELGIEIIDEKRNKYIS